jgi:hypothetical protein
VLNLEDIEETPEGLRVTIRRSKTDQEGHGHVIAIPHGVIACPVTALKAWLEAAGIAQGPVFRPVAKGGRIRATRLTDRSVADIVKAHAQRAGLDPKLFAGHSLHRLILEIDIGQRLAVVVAHYWSKRLVPRQSRAG